MSEFKPTQVKETSHGLRELEDFVNLFGYNVKIPSELIGSARLQTRQEIAEDYPLYGKYMENLKVFAQYLKAHGSNESVEAYAVRVHHIKPIYKILEIVSRMQFFKAFDETMQMYMEDDVGWGFVRLEPKYESGILMGTDVYVGDKLIDLSKPVPVQCVSWDGQLVEEYDLANLNANTTPAKEVLSKNDAGRLNIDENGKASKHFTPAAPVILGLRVSDSSVGSQSIHDEAYQRHGGLNKADIRKSMSRSILEFPLIRIISGEDDELGISTYPTPTFTELDYSHDIDFNEHLRILTICNELKEQGRFNNVREFALLNLFRWGILDARAWERGVSIFNAVMNAKPLEARPDQTDVDVKLVSWGMAVIDDLRKRNKELSDTITDDIIVSGSTISKIASMLSQSYLIMHALIVTDVTENDVGFRQAIIALQSKKEATRRFQSISRLNTDHYKIVELDKDSKTIIGVVEPIDIMAIVNYDIDAVVVSYDNDTKANSEQVEFYRAIKKYTPTAVEVVPEQNKPNA